MHAILMGAISAVCLGTADFLANGNSKRIGAAPSLAGMMLVGAAILTATMMITGGFSELFIRENVIPVVLAILHGISMAVALMVFFYAMTIGRLCVVAPIVAAHPVLIVFWQLFTGTALSVGQYISVAGVLTGVAIVGSFADSHGADPPPASRSVSIGTVVATSILASVIYAVGILFLQHAAGGIDVMPVLWFGRIAGFLTAISVVVATSKSRLKAAVTWAWWGRFSAHGVMDASGFLCILLGSTGGASNTYVAVVASTFPIVTMMLAVSILREKMNAVQLFGSALVFVNVAALIGFDP